MSALENKIRQLCLSRKITIKDFSAQIGMSNQNLYKCFNRDSIETKYLTKAAQVLQVSITYFFESTIIDIPPKSKDETKQSDKPKVVIQLELSEDKGDKVLKMIMGKDFIKLLNK